MTAFKSALLSLFCLSPLFAEDLVDTSQLGDRGVAFEGPPVSRGIRSAAGVGDFNGDGFEDVAIAVTLQRDPPRNVAMMVHGRPHSISRETLEADLPGKIIFRLNVPENPPMHLGSLGDLDDDGLADLWIGALYEPEGDEPVQGFGAVIYGAADLPPTVYLEDVGTKIRGTIYRSSHTAHGALVGVAVLQDFDGDGRRDLALGATNAPNLQGEVGAGAVFVISGFERYDGVVDLTRVGVDIPGMVIYGAVRWWEEGQVTIGNLGLALNSAGDFDGDGLTDLLATSDNLEPKVTYLLRGARALPRSLELRDVESLEGVTALVQTLDGRFTGFPQGTASLGDLNGDGRSEILLAASRGCCPGPLPTPHEVVLLIPGGTVLPRSIDVATLEQSPGVVRILPREPYTWFGTALARLGDMNGDGVPDFMVGSPRVPARGRADAGEAYVVYGSRDMPDVLDLSQGFDGLRIQGEGFYTALGQIVGPAGDFNGDGVPDVFVVAPQLSSQQPDPPRLYVIYGTGSGPAPLALLGASPRSAHVHGGAQVTFRGSGFHGQPIVQFGGLRAPSVRVVSPTELEVTTPAGDRLGQVEVSIALGGETRFLSGGFEFTAEVSEIPLAALGARGFHLLGRSGKLFAYPAVAGLELADVSGDGIDDLIAGSTEPDGWRVTVVRGGPGLPEYFDAFGGSDRLAAIRSSRGHVAAGATVTALGDVDGDGVGDLGIGASDGLAYLVLGGRRLAEPGEEEIDTYVDEGAAVSFFHAGSLGSSLHLVFAPRGDADGDGLADFAVAVAGAGEVVFFEGRTVWPEAVELADSLLWPSRIRAAGIPRFAQRLRAAGDIDGDGFRDLIADSAAFAGVGRAYIVRGASEAPVDTALADLVASGGAHEIVLLDGFESFDWLNVSGAGDVDRDGLADVLLGVEGGGPDFHGVTYILRGSRFLPPRLEVLERPSSPDGIVRIVGEGSHEQAGRPGPARDFDGDGYADIVIGAPGSQSFGEDAGNAFVVFGAGDLPAEIDLAALGGRGVKLLGTNVLGLAGTFVGPGGDLDGDGLSDVAVAEHATREGDRPVVHVVYSLRAERAFVRGDVNLDGKIDVSDAVFTLSYLFLGGEGPVCRDAGDVDDSGTLDLTDAVSLLGHLFLGGRAPPSPFPAPGRDPTADGLGCASW